VSGSWRISDEEALAELRALSLVARSTRTSEAFAEMTSCIKRCRRLGVPESELQRVI
jgi:hypothetical protein